MNSFIIGIDLGTGSCKVSLVARDFSVRAAASVAYPTSRPRPGWAEQNPEDWLRAVRKAVQQVMETSGTPKESIAALALTSAAHIGVLLDSGDKPVRPAILWNDQRSTGEVADLEARAGEDILRTSRQAVSTGWTLPHLLWVKRRDPGAWQNMRSLLLSKDYLMLWLTGERITDPATAVSAQLYDVESASWSPFLCGLAGICPDQLPEIRPATAVAGRLRAEAAVAAGLSPGTPVVNGTLDSATELLAAGILSPGSDLIRLATGGGIERVVDTPIPDRHRITYPHVTKPHWYCQAGTNTCCAALNWVMDLFAGNVNSPTFAEWDAAASGIPPGSEGVVFHPYLAGERAPHWDPGLRGSFIGLATGHGQGHIARAVYEGISFSIRQALEVLPPMPTDADNPPPAAVVGGGARSALWCRILADVLQRPLRVFTKADSAYGAALIGFAALRGDDSIQSDFASLLQDKGRLQAPDPNLGAVYARAYKEYGDIHKALAPVYAGRGAIPNS